MSYNFTNIPVVPSADDLINIVLSYTQRKTPTEIHANFKITRIRTFYMRKVKTTQQIFHKKLSEILEQFPRLDVCHILLFIFCNFLYFYLIRISIRSLLIYSTSYTIKITINLHLVS